jgi:cysteinyl-tRNA synthetase
LDGVLGLNLNVKSPLRMKEVRDVVPSGFLVEVGGDQEAPTEIRSLLRQRMQARAAKDFKLSDTIRDELKAKGWVIEDSPKGPKLKRFGSIGGA